MKKITLEIDNVIPQQGSRVSIGDRIEGKIVTGIFVMGESDSIEVAKGTILIETSSPENLGLADTLSEKES